MRNLLTQLLVSFLISSRVYAVEAPKLPTPSPTPALAPDTVCYTKDERAKIANGLVELEKCKIDLNARNSLINKNMLTFDGVQPGPAWWQEPTFVWGGMVVSFAAGGLVTYLILKDK